MSRITLLLCILLSACITTLSAQSEAELQAVYMAVLKKNGISGSIDGDGDVQFSYNDKTYFFDVDEDDVNFFRLALANIWPIESELERIQVVKAMDEANRTAKVVKLYQSNDNVWVAIEMLQEQPDDFAPFFDRLLRTIQLGVDTFVEEMP